MYLPLSIHLKGYRLVLEEDAVATDKPTGLRSEFRRKVRTQAGILQLLGTFPGLFSSRNRMRFHFLSLKIGRLMLPYLLVVLLGAALDAAHDRGFGSPRSRRSASGLWRWLIPGSGVSKRCGS